MSGVPVDSAAGQYWFQRLRVADISAAWQARPFLRYVAVSIATIVFDVALFTGLISTLHLAPTSAALMSYAIAMLAHYLLVVTFVFDAKSTGKTHHRLFAEYVTSALAGLAVTGVVISVLAEMLGVIPLLAKIAAIALTFLALYAVRRLVVFRPISRPRTSIRPVERRLT
ncbi:MAG: GtrA family protein [Hyphomicrobiaceae bacterium]